MEEKTAAVTDMDSCFPGVKLLAALAGLPEASPEATAEGAGSGRLSSDSVCAMVYVQMYPHSHSISS